MAGRVGDFLLGVQQHNYERTLIIDQVQHPDLAQESLGFTTEDLVGHPLQNFLASRIADIISEYVEFKEGGDDVADVLARTPRFALLHKSGEEIVLSLRVQRDVSMDGQPHCQLVLRDERKVARGAIHHLADLAKNDEYDDLVGLPNYGSFLTKVRYVFDLIDKKEIQASFAVVRLDNYSVAVSQFKEDAVYALLREVVLRCNQCLRASDLLCYLGNGWFTVLLLEAGKVGAQVPLNRLRAVLAHSPLQISGQLEVTSTLSIGFTELNKSASVDVLVKALSEKLNSVHEGNQLVEL